MMTVVKESLSETTFSITAISPWHVNKQTIFLSFFFLASH